MEEKPVAAENLEEGLRVAGMFFLSPIALPTAVRLATREGLEGVLATLLVGMASMHGLTEEYNAGVMLGLTHAFSLGYEVGRVLRAYYTRR